MNSSKTILPGLLVACFLTAACGKKEDSAAASSTATAAANVVEAPSASASAASPGTVTQYPNMVPQSGTVRLKQSFKVYQGADANSTVLTSLGSGTLVNLKYSYSNWMMIDWPSGVGQLSPGWIEIPNANDKRVEPEEPKKDDKKEDDSKKPPSAIPHLPNKKK